MTLLEVPAAWPHEQGRGLVVQPVALVRRLQLNRAFDRLGQVRLALEQVGPGGRVRVPRSAAMNTFAPELRALITIFRSVGPVISTRRSRRSFGIGATFQFPSRTDLVSGRKSGSAPASSFFCRSSRAWRSISRVALNLRWRPARKATLSL